jgi:hypothetical protein
MVITHCVALQEYNGYGNNTTAFLLFEMRCTNTKSISCLTIQKWKTTRKNKKYYRMLYA